ncbi:E3 ubiquitin-protein ligase TRIM39-like [Notechis scutatus]|uniref:E3 ubiquitin-protein ligase TRIM39-like n=1 Tax=Notechis scutatus TaxID=8663 RepID=A0A6J1VTG5_9SAUR|nr:E3 ubiquitin-protein ligase TRIM39-like [Notechis scutatus]
MDWADLEPLLRSHYAPAVPTLIRQHDFYLRDQKPGESISDFVADLRNLGGMCGFTDMDEVLRDRVVLRLRDPDIGSILKKFQAKETYENPVDLLPEPKWDYSGSQNGITIWDYSDIPVLLKSAMKKLRDTLESGLQLQEENVTLDPGTANLGRLEISKDRKSVKGLKPVEGKYAVSDCNRFVRYPCVLGCEKFSTGRHFWEVIIGGAAEWAIGVASKPRNIKNVDEQTSHWEIAECKGKYMAISPSTYSDLVLTEELTRIRIFLNCERGQVSFYDVRTAALLHIFLDASLVGETFWPYFFLGEGTCMTLP